MKELLKKGLWTRQSFNINNMKISEVEELASELGREIKTPGDLAKFGSELKDAASELFTEDEIIERLIEKLEIEDSDDGDNESSEEGNKHEAGFGGISSF